MIKKSSKHENCCEDVPVKKSLCTTPVQEKESQIQTQLEKTSKIIDGLSFQTNEIYSQIRPILTPFDENNLVAKESSEITVPLAQTISTLNYRLEEILNFLISVNEHIDIYV